MVKFLRNSGYKTVFIALTTVFLYSCQDDFLEIGGDLVDNVSYTSDSLTLPVTAYNRSFFDEDGVQTNNLSSGALGVYKDPLYGQTIAATLSQLSISPANPTVGDSVVVDSVVVTLPYYSTATAPTAEGGTEYRLDSVYGEAAMNITAFRSNYFLSDNDPQDVSQNAVYYSNQLDQFTGIKGDSLFSISNFVPSNTEIEESIPPAQTSTDSVNTIERSAPALRVNLNSEEQLLYWKNAILDRAGSDVLFNQNSFKNYFRGIYIEAEPINDQGSYFLFDRAAAQIEIYYTASNSSGSRNQATITLSMNPSAQIGVVGFTNDFKPGIVAEASMGDATLGDESLFLKGGQGSMAVIDLFGEDTDGDGIPEQLEALRAQGSRIMREANLTFYVDQEKLSQYGGQNVTEPDRIYIYDLETNQPLADYSVDAQRANQNGPITAIGITHLGPLRRDANDRGTTYTIRITEHIKNLLNPENASPSTKLGVVVAENLLPSGVATGAIQNTTANDIPSRLPITTILSQKGTILHGSQSADPAKQLSLKLFFIETPNQ